MRHPTVFSLAAASVACFLLSGALWAAPLTSQSLMVIGVGFTICTFIAMFKYRARSAEARPYDPYDLRDLHKLVEEEERESELDAASTSYGSAMCRCCGELYDPKLAVCPKCGRSQYC